MARCRIWLEGVRVHTTHMNYNLPYFDRATKDALTAKESSIGNSGGTTLVMIRTQSSKSLDFFRSRSMPAHVRE
jgi:hypothetical protein